MGRPGRRHARRSTTAAMTAGAGAAAATVAPMASTGGGQLVTLTGVSKRFGPNLALSALDLGVPGGQITVLLGPNGAGKTTAIRMITGAFAPDAGVVRAFGLDPAVDGDEVRARCGVVSAKPSLYERLSGLDNLRYAAELHGLGRGASADGRIARRTTASASTPPSPTRSAATPPG